jgi:hypothetical protein
MTLLPLTRADDATLHWRQPSAWHHRFLLAAANGREFATLDIESSWTTHARALTAEGAWVLRSVGTWHPRVVVSLDGQDDPIATFEITNVWLGNRAELRSGERVIAVWEMTSLLRGNVRWTDASGAPLIEFRAGTDEGGVFSWRTECRVDFTDAGFAHADRDLLVCLGWYFTVLSQNPAI